MSDHTPETQDTPPEAPQTDAIDQSRRKLTGSALGVAAVFTLASRPVLATNCVAPSAAASGNLSHHGTPPRCSGKDWNHWKNSRDYTRYYKDKKFHEVQTGCFAMRNSARVDWEDKKVDYVANKTDNGNTARESNPVSREFLVALMNIKAGHIDNRVLDENKLRQMWNEWVETGAYKPSATATPWNSTQIVNYLRGLQG